MFLLNLSPLIPFFKINTSISKIEIENIIGNKEGAVKILLSGILILKDSNKYHDIKIIRNNEENISIKGAAFPAPSSSDINFL